MKRHAPATERNREPIVAVLSRVLPAKGTVLELASGSGQHAVFFASRLPHLRWQPTDRDVAALASIEAWSAEAKVDNVEAPRHLDTTEDEAWPTCDAVV